MKKNVTLIKKYTQLKFIDVKLHIFEYKKNKNTICNML